MAETTPTIQSITGDAEIEEQAPIFSESSPYDVPESWRTYKSARLSVPQINAILADAYAHKITFGDSVIPDYGGARLRFEGTHEIVDGFWVGAGKEATE